MNRLQENLLNISKKTKLLVPMTLIALMSVLNSWCVKTTTEHKEDIQNSIAEYQKKDLNSNFIYVGDWVYYYSWSWSEVEWSRLSWEETAVALAQFEHNHPELEIIEVIKDFAYGHSDDGMTIITEPRQQ